LLAHLEEISRVKAREAIEDRFVGRRRHIEMILQAYREEYHRDFKARVGAFEAGCEPFAMFNLRGALAEEAACKELGIEYPNFHIPSLRNKIAPELGYLIVQDRATGRIQLQHLDGNILSEKF